MTGTRRPKTPPGVVSDADERLWREVTRDAVPLKGGKRSAPAATPPPPRPERTPRPPPVARPAVTLPPTDPGQGLDKRTAERLRRGQLPVEARVDLHGMTQEQAHRALDAFVAGNHGAGRRVLLVITGRGFKADARQPEESIGVLRQMVPRWLKEAPNRARVLATAQAQPKDGGAGALYVLLRRKRAGVGDPGKAPR